MKDLCQDAERLIIEDKLTEAQAVLGDALTGIEPTKDEIGEVEVARALGLMNIFIGLRESVMGVLRKTEAEIAVLPERERKVFEAYALEEVRSGLGA